MYLKIKGIGNRTEVKTNVEEIIGRRERLKGGGSRTGREVEQGTPGPVAGNSRPGQYLLYGEVKL